MDYRKFKDTTKTLIMKEFSSTFANGNYLTNLQARKKEDNSIVTYLDLKISEIFHDQITKHEKLNSFHFCSEEKEFTELKYPAMIIDPIDGTRELARGIPECSVSCGLLLSPDLNNKENWGWILNPFTGFEISSSRSFQPPMNYSQGALLGLVSRSEWNKGLFAKKVQLLNQLESPSSNPYPYITLAPRGSIAFKLGLLAAGAIDFIVSYRPKNIWDIAGGTILCHQQGINFFEKESLVQRLDQMRFHPPLLWCRPEIHPLLLEYFAKVEE